MKLLYLDCSMGAAGDMLAAALLELLPDPAGFVERLNSLGLPGVEFSLQPSVKCGITGSHLAVTVHGAEEDDHQHHGHDPHHRHEYGHHGHDHQHHEHSRHHGHDHHEHGGHHEHLHAHHHQHRHNTLADIRHTISHLPVSERARDDALAVYELLAQAEGHVHGVAVNDIHFHEVGTLDAVADITAVCMLMEELSPDQVVVSPVHVGSGQVRCAHGILPVPAPATAHLLRGIPIYGGEIQGELCTPTGAALLKHFGDKFGPMPPMTPTAAGYGMGKRDFPAANCLRAMLGDSGDDGEQIYELCCNLDDTTGEELGYAMERLFAEGALDVYTVPIGMKKSRPGIMLCVLCREGQREIMAETIFRHTATLGVRERLHRRYVLRRDTDTLDTPYGPVTVKSSHGFGVERYKYEYEDLARIAGERGISINEARALLDGQRF